VISFQRMDYAIPFKMGSFVDIDSDNDYDYIIPGGIYTVNYIENIGSPSWPIWDTISVLIPPDGRLYQIYTVTSGDIDNDGDYDLFVAHRWSANLYFYRNTGTPHNPDFTFANELILPNWDFNGPHDALLEDIDGDNDLDLLIGETFVQEPHRIRLIFYRNDGTPEQPVWVHVTDDFQNATSEHRNGGLAPCLADIDNDGDKDLVVTNNGYGLQLFLNPEIQTDIWDNDPEQTNNPKNPFIIQCYPNPFNSAVTISVGNTPAEDMVIDIYDILGRFQESLDIDDNSAIWNPAGYSSGVYFARVRSSQNTAVRKLLYLK